VAAHKALQSAAADKDFYQAKLHTAQFYFRRILPRTLMLSATIRDGVDALMSIDAAQIANAE
jgi:hypothetical protein